jgi:hypothetical protein
MDHAYIKEHNIVDRYDIGKLSAAECASFEEHFVDCPECQSQLSTARDFRLALRAATLEERHVTALAPAALPAAVPAWRWALLGAAACLAVLAVPALFLIRETRHLNGEVGRLNNVAQSWQQRYEAEHQTNRDLQSRMALPVIPSGSAHAPALASVFPLSVTRGGDPDGSEPVDRVVVSNSLPWVVLLLDSDGHDFQSFRATLAQSNGQVLWRADHLTPADSNTIAITLPSSLFHPDNYLLTLDGLTRNGGYAVAGHYSFRVSFRR